MDKTWKIKISLDSIAMYDSLHQAIQQAGGTGASFSAKRLRTMTVAELIAELAPNGIRFHHVLPAKNVSDYYQPLDELDMLKELLAEKNKCECDNHSKCVDEED